jgi:glutamate-1-semialdehyde 2,1-aminomutase
VREGVLLGLTGPHEGQLAQLISEAVPGVEQVRFTASGTEACMTAVRLARAHTGRPKVLLCQGAYHGHADTLLAGLSAGVPEALEQTLVRVPFNNVGGLEKALAAEGARIACAILEPVAANCGVIPPAPGYLARARELTARHGALLIFDEVVTGFRLGPAGAQGLYGVRPDLTVFGKIIGGGLPIGALAGPRRLMQHLAPEGPVYHAGTFAGHPLSMAAGVATLRCLRREPPYGALERLGRALEQDVCEAAGRAGVPVCVNRVGSMLTAFFSQRPVRDAADAAAADRDRFALWARGLLDERILVPPSPLEAMFVSTAHRAADVERLVEATARCLKRAGRRRRQGA